MNIRPHSASHMNNMRASRTFEKGLISTVIIKVLQLSRHVSRRRYSPSFLHSSNNFVHHRLRFIPLRTGLDGPRAYLRGPNRALSY